MPTRHMYVEPTISTHSIVLTHQICIYFADTGTQYSWCFFKALMTMIGLGFESPPLVNTVCTERTDWCAMEHWITLICLYIGSIFYALLISSVSFVMANLDKGGSNLSEMLWGINEYLKNKKVPLLQVSSFLSHMIHVLTHCTFALGACAD